MLGLPIAYIIADMTYLTVSQTLVDALTIGILLTFPYALYTANDRFLTCSDFERIGDFQPENCRP